MLRIAVVDDEPLMRERMQSYLEQFGKQYGHAMNIRVFPFSELFLTNYRPVFDIVLMDIDMPGMNGMEAARRMRQLDQRAVLIFVTNLAQYALQGYEVDATDFIVKPFSYEKFEQKLLRAVRRLPRSDRPYLILKVEDGSVMVSIDDIKYVEVQGHNVFYHTVREVYRVRGSLKETFKELNDPQFFICNKCYIVNLAYVAAVNGSDVVVDDESIEVSRPKKKALMNALAAFHNQR